MLKMMKQKTGRGMMQSFLPACCNLCAVKGGISGLEKKETTRSQQESYLFLFIAPNI